MDPKKLVDKLRAQIHREQDRHPGGKGEIDRRMGHKPGFLTRKTGEKFNLKVLELADATYSMGTEPAEFFGEAFDILPGPEDLLRRQEGRGPACQSLARIEAAALALEAEPPTSSAPPTATRSREQLQSFVRTGLHHQRKVLREESWARDPVAMRHYLEQLDGLRFDRAVDAALLAEAVAVAAVGNVACPQDERLELMCHAIGAYASAQRVVGEFSTAARAIGFALRLTGRHGLMAARASLLQRGAYALRDAGFFDHALELLDNGVVLWAELGRTANLGMIMIDRAIIFGHKDEILRADRVFKTGLDHLSGDTEAHRMFRIAAAHGIAFTQLRMGDPHEAERWLDRAIELVRDDEPSALAKLIRQKGEMYYERRAFFQAERAFTSARKILAVKENPIQGALVALDVAAALKAQGKLAELKELAEGMVALLGFFEANRLAAAALLAFIHAAQAGRVTERLIVEVGKKLGRARPLRRARPQDTIRQDQ